MSYRCLDDLQTSVTPKHEAGDPTAFSNQVQAAAEHLLAVVDGKPKEAFGTTYSQIKEVIGKIHLSGYLDQAQETIIYEETVESELPPQEPIQNEQIMNLEVLPPQTQDIMPPIDTLTIEPVRPPLPPVVEPPTIEQQAPPQLPPEQMYFQQPPPPQPQMPQPQPPRPISEVLGAGKFFFLQVRCSIFYEQ